MHEYEILSVMGILNGANSVRHSKYHLNLQAITNEVMHSVKTLPFPCGLDDAHPVFSIYPSFFPFYPVHTQKWLHAVHMFFPVSSFGLSNSFPSFIFFTPFWVWNLCYFLLRFIFTKLHFLNLTYVSRLGCSFSNRKIAPKPNKM